MWDRFVRACRSEKVDRTPVWFMRQAGRYMPEYQQVRAHHSILDICHNPGLAAEVTITAAEQLGVDAAIIFADLLLPAEPLGLKLRFEQGEGPIVEPAIRDRIAIASLKTELNGALGYVSEAITKVKKHFHNKLPVIGFAGAPFTLASYLIEGGSSRSFALTKTLMYNDPAAWARLMEKICPVLVEFLSEQVQAGADVIQLFDSWAGALSEEDYRHHALPYNQLIVDAIQDLGVPVIYFSTGTGGYLETVRETHASVIGVDWRVRLDTARARLSVVAYPPPAVMGNLDPLRLFAPQESIKRSVDDILQQGAERPGHIFNLGHGILPDTPVENVKAIVQWVKDGPRYTEQPASGPVKAAL